MNVDEKYNLITRGLHEVIGDTAEIKKILSERQLKIYWGTAPTGRIHIGYFVPMLKIADYLRAGCHVTILLADLHAFLDNMKSTYQQVEIRTQYYEIMLSAILRIMGLDAYTSSFTPDNIMISSSVSSSGGRTNSGQLKFVRGSSYQLSEKYNLDVYKANSFVTVARAQHAGAEVVKQSENPAINGLLYPTLQALDEEYLGVDAEHGGVDQRKIFGHAMEIMPRLGYKKRFYFLNDMVPGLKTNKDVAATINNCQGNVIAAANQRLASRSSIDAAQSVETSLAGQSSIVAEKMSSSIAATKLDLLDSPLEVRNKINKCYCPAGTLIDNPLLIILEKMLWPILKYKNINFVINRPAKFGGQITYNSLDDIKRDFVTSIADGEYKLHPADLKMGIADALNMILEPIRSTFDTADMRKLLKNAYP